MILLLLLFVQFELKIAVHAVLTKKKICEVKNFFHFDVLMEELVLLLSVGKSLSGNLDSSK